MKERRKFPRKPVSIPVTVSEITSQRLKADLLKTKITNLSKTGFYINTPQFKILSFLRLEIFPTNAKEKIRARGIVQFNDGRGVGIKFIHPENTAERQVLDQFISAQIEALGHPPSGRPCEM
ncbi:MAG: PilZ domain-containing protein [Nitrospinota bacterium]